MKNIFIVFDIYKPFMHKFFNKNENKNLDYIKTVEKIGLESLSTGFFYYKNFKNTKKYNPYPIISNCKNSQLNWARKNEINFDLNDWKNQIFLNQIELLKPEIIFFDSFNSFETEELRLIKKNNKFIKLFITWEGIANCEIDKLNVYNIIVSPLHYLVDFYNKNGIKSYHMALSFEPSVFENISRNKTIDVSFTGSINLFKEGHFKRLKFLYNLSKKINIKLYLANVRSYRYFISIIRCILKFDFKSIFYLTYLSIKSHTPRIGIEMLKVIASSKIAVNIHIDAAKNEAANLRMYEVTGVGTCLLTDFKENLNNYFELNNEVVAYKTVDDCINKIKTLLKDENEIKRLSFNGQQKTFKEHSFKERVNKLVMIIEKNL